MMNTLHDDVIRLIVLQNETWLSLRAVSKRFKESVDQIARENTDNNLEKLFKSLLIRRVNRDGYVPIRLLYRHKFSKKQKLPKYKCSRCHCKFVNILENHVCKRIELKKALYGPAFVSCVAIAAMIVNRLT